MPLPHNLLVHNTNVLGNCAAPCQPHLRDLAAKGKDSARLMASESKASSDPLEWASAGSRPGCWLPSALLRHHPWRSATDWARSESVLLVLDCSRRHAAG